MNLHETLTRWLAKGGPPCPGLQWIALPPSDNPHYQPYWHHGGNDYRENDREPAALLGDWFADNLYKVFPHYRLVQLWRGGWRIIGDGNQDGPDKLGEGPTIWQAVAAAMETLEG
jgi:hypothetical protein